MNYMAYFIGGIVAHILILFLMLLVLMAIIKSICQAMYLPITIKVKKYSFIGAFLLSMILAFEPELMQPILKVIIGGILVGIVARFMTGLSGGNSKTNDDKRNKE